MSLVFNEEQRQLKDAAKSFLNENAPVAALRTLRDNKDALGYSQQLWQQMAELGWAMVTIPEQYDGLGFGYLGLGAIAEESGHTLTASPLFGSIVLEDVVEASLGQAGHGGGVHAVIVDGTECIHNDRAC